MEVFKKAIRAHSLDLFKCVYACLCMNKCVCVRIAAACVHVWVPCLVLVEVRRGLWMASI